MTLLDKLNTEWIRGKLSTTTQHIQKYTDQILKVFNTKKSDIKTVAQATAAATVFILGSFGAQAKPVDVYYQLVDPQKNNETPSKGKISISMSEEVARSSMTKPIKIIYNGKAMLISSQPIVPVLSEPMKIRAKRPINKTPQTKDENSGSSSNDPNLSLSGSSERRYNPIHPNIERIKIKPASKKISQPNTYDPLHDNLTPETIGAFPNPEKVIKNILETGSTNRSGSGPSLETLIENNPLQVSPTIKGNGGGGVPLFRNSISSSITRTPSNMLNLIASTEHSSIETSKMYHTINIKDIYDYLVQKYPGKKVKRSQVLGSRFAQILKENGYSKFTNIRNVKTIKIKDNDLGQSTQAT